MITHALKRKIKLLLQRLLGKTFGALTAGKAYNLLADAYDDQPRNIMMLLDNKILSELLAEVSVLDKIIADVGCGTGRHWPRLTPLKPDRIIGYDVSARMLEVLRRKNPAAETIQTTNHILPATDDNSIDIIISSLTLIYIPSLRKIFKEWDRVLRPGGSIILTSNHPAIFQHGDGIVFNHRNTMIAVDHVIHTPDGIMKQAGMRGWTFVTYTEEKVNESVKDFFHKDAGQVYEAMIGKPIIFGFHFRKK